MGRLSSHVQPIDLTVAGKQHVFQPQQGEGQMLMLNQPCSNRHYTQTTAVLNEWADQHIYNVQHSRSTKARINLAHHRVGVNALRYTSASASGQRCLHAAHRCNSSPSSIQHPSNIPLNTLGSYGLKEGDEIHGDEHNTRSGIARITYP